MVLRKVLKLCDGLTSPVLTLPSRNDWMVSMRRTVKCEDRESWHDRGVVLVERACEGVDGLEESLVDASFDGVEDFLPVARIGVNARQLWAQFVVACHGEAGG